jgi:membrane-bound serine protease (ClpP class)
MRRVLIAATLVAASSASWGAVGRVVVDGVIGPVSTKIITRALNESVEAGYTALIIELDTPGGLDMAMRDIISEVLASPIPVIVYVAPSGARAASAGLFILQASHVAAMAPGTNVGAAHPVAMGGQMDSTMSEKVEHDAAAYIRSIAARRGRNAEWAEKAVRESVSITETEADSLGVIDFIAPTLDSLLSAADGRVVLVGNDTVVVRTAGAEVITIKKRFQESFLETITNPNIAYLLMMLGMLGIYFELSNPGAIFPGVVGAVCLLLALFAFQSLPINLVGVALIILGVVLFLLEIKIISYGLLSIGGTASIVLGSIMLIDSPAPYLRVSLSVIIVAVVTIVAFFLLAMWLAIGAHRRKVSTGREGIIGETGRTLTPLAPEGQVRVHGEIWAAVADSPVARGERVVVTGTDGLMLRVTPAEESR